jgi:hypothetical protein
MQEHISTPTSGLSSPPLGIALSPAHLDSRASAHVTCFFAGALRWKVSVHRVGSGAHRRVDYFPVDHHEDLYASSLPVRLATAAAAAALAEAAPASRTSRRHVII